jgi:DNA-binding XRE family transcriptional regulator
VTGRFKNTPDAFWKKVHVSTRYECWPWLASVRNGYGNFTINYRSCYAHRFAYTDVKGPIPDGMDVMHRCNNKICCNPAHLLAGTPAKNTQDAYRDRLAPSGPNHHRAKLSEEQVRQIRASKATQTALAKQFGVGQQTISRIKTGFNWKHYAAESLT